MRKKKKRYVYCERRYYYKYARLIYTVNNEDVYTHIYIRLKLNVDTHTHSHRHTKALKYI